jgi:hypothetical protein
MFNLLTQLQVDFTNEVTKSTRGFEWIQDNYRYDFYFEKNEHKYFVEMDGGFHRYENVRKIDDIKDCLARRHDIEVIRINCDYLDLTKRFEFIKNNTICSKLGSIFDLSKTDWKEIEVNSLQSNVIAASNLWNDEAKNVGEIAKLLGVSLDATRKYLIMASNLNMCWYTPEASHQRSNTGMQRSKRIALYKNELLVDVFYSAAELSRQSKELYGVCLNHSSVCRACRENMGRLRGFTLQYISEEEYNRLKLIMQNKYNNLQEVG